MDPPRVLIAGLAPLSRPDPLAGLTPEERVRWIAPLRRRQAELLARPSPPTIRISEIDECIAIVARVLRELAAERHLDIDLGGEVSTPLPLGTR